MSDANQISTSGQDWNQFMEEMNENVLDALERNVEAQTTFVEAWMAALGDSTAEETFEDGVQGYARAYEVWMEAAQEQFERVSDAIEGEEVEPEEFRDIWLNTANEAFKEVMSTTAFAAATGQTVDNVLELQQEVDQTAEQTLHALGFPTEGDVREVGERLVELERRQHEVEQRIDGVGQRFDATEDRLVTVDDRIARFGDYFDEFEADFEDVGERLSGVSEEVEAVGEEVETVSEEVETVGGDVTEVGDEVESLGDRLDALEERVDTFEDRFDAFEDRFDSIDGKLDQIADAVGEE